MSKEFVMKDISLRALSLLSSVMAIWSCVDFAKKAANAKDGYDYAWFVSMSVLYAFTAVFYLLGVIFPPFAVLANALMGIISIVYMFY